MNEIPLISCVMPTYGRPAYVNEAVWMFLQQDYPNKELIVLNDCHGQILRSDLPRRSGVRVINRDTRYASLGEKRNACIEMAEGELIAVWDDDDVYLPWRLSYSLQQMRKHGTPFYRANEFWAYWGEPELHDNQVVREWVSHPLCLFTKHLWGAAGGYPPINVGEDSRFYDRVDGVLADMRGYHSSYPIRRFDRYFILRGKSQYPHMSMKGGRGRLETGHGFRQIEPRPMGDLCLKKHYESLIARRCELVTSD